MHAIGKAFASSSHLKQIDLSRNGSVGNEGIASLANAAREQVGKNGDAIAFPSLETIVFSECNIGPSGVQYLCDMLRDDSNRTRSKRVNVAISSNPIGPDGCRSLSKLCSVPRRGSIVSQLHMSQCSVGDEGARALSDAATSSGPLAGLSVLDLSENSITVVGARALSDALVESLPDLIELKLAKNELTGEGVASIVGSLVGISDIGASSCENGDEPANKNSTLKSLDLTCTDCGVDGARAALTCGGITSLRLFNNKLGSNGFHSIATLLRGGHPSIVNLDLGGNNADEDAVVALLDAIADKGGDGNDCASSSNKLAVLEIGGNKFGEKAMEALNRLKNVWPELDVAHDKPVQDALVDQEEKN